MIIVTVSAELTSILFLLVIQMGLYRVKGETSKQTKYFRSCVWANILALFTDAMSYALVGNEQLGFLIGPTNFFAYIFVDILISIFSGYIYAIIEEKEKNFSGKLIFFVSILCALDILFISIGTITGELFIIKNNQMIRGPWHSFVVIIPAICLVSVQVMLLIKSDKIGFKNTIILSSYLFMPILAMALQLLNPDLALGYVGAALGMSVTYVMIQSKTVNETALRAEIYNSLSSKDVLTGLKNRRGYQEVLDSIDGEDDFGVVFCDLNGLKAVNDNEGHEAGDNLIKRFAELLRDFFEDDEIFRISGDEFVIILSETGEIEERMAAFAKILNENNRISAFGYASDKGKRIIETVKAAEQMMYRDKSAYYKETGKDRRS